MEDFGQKVKQTTYIASILTSYPAGNQILSELIQNSDDAKSTEVRIILDERNLPRVNLIYDTLAPFQGPSLLLYNNSTFTDRDYASISVSDTIIVHFIIF